MAGCSGKEDAGEIEVVLANGGIRGWTQSSGIWDVKA